ncbi:MAG: 3'-5' exoribonuclease [Ignavibacteriales bacterium]|nr:MAG: 3'-5' exoribonuclease [Ignavibacteriales bacterium]
MNRKKITDLPVEEAEFAVVDVETTGLNARYNNIIEIGIVKVSNQKITGKYQSLINPAKNIPYFITQMTGISDDDVYNAPMFDEVAEEIKEFIGASILTAHNFSFDYSFLKREFENAGVEPLSNPQLCTLKIARRMYPMLRSKSLGSVCSHLNVKNKNAHRALDDAEVTAKILIKMIKELKKSEEVLNVPELINYQYVISASAPKLKIKKELGDDIVSLPDAPGIYSFLNNKNEIIYIGKAKSLRARLKSYFSPTAPRKTKKILKQATRLKIEITNSELTALLTEAEAIKIVNPKHNTMLKKYGNKYFIRINTSHPFPSVELINSFDFDGNDYFGLFTTRKQAVQVMEMLDKTFSLRECDEKEFNRGKACFLSEIERCTAPCINKNKNIYEDELEKVYEFLYGKNQFALNRLLNRMKEYSDSQKYDKAAVIKSLIDLILAQTHKSSLLAEPVNSANVLFEITENRNKDYLLLLSGKIFIKKYLLDSRHNFDTAIDDYFEGTIQQNIMPSEEDLEKMKITLNWLVKNRNKVRAFYLKEYTSKEELYSVMSRNNFRQDFVSESVFDIKNFLREEIPDSILHED